MFLKMWYARNFKVISAQQALRWKLEFDRGVYGDEINLLNCRSIWRDAKNRTYRVQELTEFIND